MIGHGMMGNSFLLDNVTNATVAYSTARQLRTGQASCLSVRRQNTGSYLSPAQDIGFLNGVINESAIETYRNGALSLHAPTWHDQSGNGNNANNFSSTPASVPVVYTSNSYVRLNGKLSPYFAISVSRFLAFTSIAISSEYTIFVVSQSPSNAVNGMIIGGAIGNSTNIYVGKFPNALQNADAVDLRQATNTNTSPTVLCFDKSAGTKRIFENGTQLSTTTVTFARANNTLGLIGAVGISPSGYTYAEGRIAEVIIYNRALTTQEREYVTNDIRAFYGV